jgi:hypothetical protein
MRSIPLMKLWAAAILISLHSSVAQPSLQPHPDASPSSHILLLSDDKKHHGGKKKPVNDQAALNPAKSDCTIPVHSTAEAQCKYVLEFCMDDKDSPGLFNYLEFYYCDMATNGLRWLGALLLLLHLGFLFTFLGTASSDYFCPNLSTLSNAMRLPHDVAGVCFIIMIFFYGICHVRLRFWRWEILRPICFHP